MKCFALLIGLGLLGLASRSQAEIAGGTGLQITAAGDIVGNFGGNMTNRLDPREAEILLFAPVDYLFDAVLNAAAHYETGALNFEVHELYIGSSKLIPRSRFRVGQFFLGVGRLNQIHRHDWPFTSAPKVQSVFLSEEGVADTAIEYGYLLPTSFYLDLTVGVANGWKFGEAPGDGLKPLFPTHYFRLVTYNALFSGGGMQTGLNYVSRTEDSGKKTTLLGVDLTAKWREGATLNFLLQSEFWVRLVSPRGYPTETTFGFYIYPQYALSQNWSVGLRIDGYSERSLVDATTLAKIGNYDYGLVPMVAYKASEFSTLRASYNWKGSLMNGAETAPERGFELQAVFILGTHPAHDF